MSISSPVKDVFMYLLFLSILYLFFFGNEQLIEGSGISIQAEWRAVFIVFLGILFEALPFLILGVIAASLIQLFISEEWIQKVIPKKPIAGMVVGLLASIVTPVCECAIIPVVRRLIQKGVPVHAGAVLLMGAPILNFVVFGSTYYAFQHQLEIFYGRFILCIITAFIAGAIIYIYFSKANVLKISKEDLLVKFDVNKNKGNSKLKGVLHHTSHEFFAVGKYFIIGAFIASIAQVYVHRSALSEVAGDPITGTAMMMGFAYLLSLCSEADAFVAASFGKVFLPESLLAFLVYGPMLDIKNTLVMFASFRIRFVLFYIFIVTVVVFSLSLLAGSYIAGGGGI